MSKTSTVTYSKAFSKKTKLLISGTATLYSVSASIASQSATGCTITHKNNSSTTQYGGARWVAINADYYSS